MNILIKTYAGSHLFGTSTPESDTDYKGIYLPSSEQILLGNYPETIQQTTGASDEKNSKEVIVLVGLPGSGKSSWKFKSPQSYDSFFEVSRDFIIGYLGKGESYNEK